MLVAIATGLVSGSAAALAEGMHCALDAGINCIYSAALQEKLEALWRRYGEADVLAFGPRRLSVLFQLSVNVLAAGGALFIGLDAMLELCLPGAHDHSHHQAHQHSHSHGDEVEAVSASEHAIAVPWAAAVVSALATLGAYAYRRIDGAGSTVGGGSRTGGEPPPSRRPLARFGTLALSWYFGAAPLGADPFNSTRTPAEGEVAFPELYSLLQPPAPGELPEIEPPVRELIKALLRHPDATAGVLLCALALIRGVKEGLRPARLLLQMAPPPDMVPDLEQRLARARAVPGVLEIRDVQLWAIDHTAATGSLVVIARADADVQAVLQRVHAAVEGGALNGVIIGVEKDDDDDEDDGWSDVALAGASGRRVGYSFS